METSSPPGTRNGPTDQPPETTTPNRKKQARPTGEIHSQILLVEGEEKRQGTGVSGTINATGPRQVTSRGPVDTDQANKAWKERASTDKSTPTGGKRKANETGDRKSETRRQRNTQKRRKTPRTQRGHAKGGRNIAQRNLTRHQGLTTSAPWSQPYPNPPKLTTSALANSSQKQRPPARKEATRMPSAPQRKARKREKKASLTWRGPQERSRDTSTFSTE